MDAFSLTNGNGMEVRFLAYGATIVSVRVPDRDGVFADVVAGYDTLEEYRADTRFFGSVVGRYANRLANGRFTLDGRTYELPLNDRPNHLHGGPAGFHTKEWRVAPFRRPWGVGAVLCVCSAAGDQGYPGTLHARVTYTLSNDDALTVDYDAITDEPTPVAFTQHSYWNLAGHDAGDILDHQLTISSTYFTPVDATLVPTGVLRGVLGTPFDFTGPQRIGSRIEADDDQLRLAGGYDHNFMLSRPDAESVVFAARLYEPVSGRVLDVSTTEPGLQVYTGNTIHRGPPGKGGHAYGQYGAVALETQHFPDSPNHPHFPSTILRPGDVYRSRTVYRFSTRPTAA